MRQPLFFLLGLFACLTLSSFVEHRLEEFGRAGYYADALQGRKTASGEKYNKNILTCAHKSYPFGTKLRVTRLDNKKAVIVRVNDRGPFTEGFVVDLSRAAAEEIDLVQAGRANVKVEVVETVFASASGGSTATVQNDRETYTPRPQTQLLKPQKKAKPAPRPATYNTEDPTPAATQRYRGEVAKDAGNSELYRIDLRSSVKAGFGIQVSTIYDADNVLPIITKLQGQYPGKVLVSVERDEANDQSTYRVILGPYPTRRAAENQQRVAERQGNKKCFVVDLSTI